MTIDQKSLDFMREMYTALGKHLKDVCNQEPSKPAKVRALPFKRKPRGNYSHGADKNWMTLTQTSKITGLSVHRINKAIHAEGTGIQWRLFGRFPMVHVNSLKELKLLKAMLG